ncbi:MAG: CDP-diacylglycerol--glycerol-3-phosphate 3-phosphatidyltransferase [Planctomycetes bacterium]|nr:CDP-diacylglycerol--glycerol-3-phosphate 3-phosphatidyltransferase [Planctomycetota bacterium]
MSEASDGATKTKRRRLRVRRSPEARAARKALRASRKEQRRPLSEEIKKLPNLLTLGRIVAIPPVMALLLMDTPQSDFWAVLLFSLAAITDWLDGYLARKQGLVSLLGKFLDPLADKLIVQAVLIVCAELGRIPSWFVVLLLSREIAITGLRAIASSEGLQIEVVRAGKMKTALQLVGLVALILHHRYLIDFLVAEAVVDFNVVGVALLSLSMVFSLLSAFSYFRSFARAVADRAQS